MVSDQTVIDPSADENLNALCDTINNTPKGCSETLLRVRC